MKREITRLRHKITTEQILALLQGKTLRVITDDLDLEFYPPQDVMTMSREEWEKLKRQVQYEAYDFMSKALQDKSIDITADFIDNRIRRDLDK